VLKYLQTPINGVNVPWLYVGMLFSSFCWHNEDNYLYSINYNHMGATKQWYGVPGNEAKNFDKVSKDFLMELFRESPDQLHHMTTQISPSLLVSQGIPIYQIKHEPRTFLVTFPKAYHAGFSYGFNVGEAVNFATYDWLVAGGEAEERYRFYARNSVFSHQRLLFTLLHHKTEIEAQFHSKLATEILKVLEEELSYRPFIFGQGVRDISAKVKLPPNSFKAIDLVAADYDDMRGCHICKHICVFSAIACECDKTKVACIRHFNALCKCPKDKKYMLEWASTKDLMSLRQRVNATIQAQIVKKEPVISSPVTFTITGPDMKPVTAIIDSNSDVRLLPLFTESEALTSTQLLPSSASIHPSLITSSVIQPSVVQPSVVQPSIVQSSIVQPSVIQPSVIQPSVVQPSVIQPSLAPIQPSLNPSPDKNTINPPIDIYSIVQSSNIAISSALSTSPCSTIPAVDL